MRQPEPNDNDGSDDHNQRSACSNDQLQSGIHEEVAVGERKNPVPMRRDGVNVAILDPQFK